MDKPAPTTVKLLDLYGRPLSVFHPKLDQEKPFEDAALKSQDMIDALRLILPNPRTSVSNDRNYRLTVLENNKQKLHGCITPDFFWELEQLFSFNIGERCG